MWQRAFEPRRQMEQGLYDYLIGLLTPERLAGFERVLSLRTRFLTLAFEDLYHQRNISACIRSCDCFGVQDVHVIEGETRFKPNSQIALGAANWVTVKRYHGSEDPTRDCIDQLRASGFRIVATSPRVGHQSVRDLPLSEKTAIFFGTEKHGLSDQVFENADECVRIPMSGFTESFNISVSAAIVLYELTERLRSERDDWQLTEDEKQTLRAQWVEYSLGPKLDSLLRRYERDHGPTSS